MHLNKIPIKAHRKDGYFRFTKAIKAKAYCWDNNEEPERLQQAGKIALALFKHNPKSKVRTTEEDLLHRIA